MDERTLTALKGSIAKWEAIVDGTGEDKGPENCPLCGLFNNQVNPWNFCVGCPVRAATGVKLCENTPYVAYDDDPTTANAQAELNFLKSLLPADEACDG
jgi:hypothetical protein